MKEDEVPQDKSILGGYKRACYAVANNGQYKIVESQGWEVEKIVNSLAHEDFTNKLIKVKEEIKNNISSPIKYYMLKNKMDLNILSQYTGFYKWQIKRHFNPSVFYKMNKKTINIYLSVFGITYSDLKEFNLQ